MIKYSTDLWTKRIKDTYVQLNQSELTDIKKDHIKELVKRQDIESWWEDISSKSTLHIYTENKVHVDRKRI